MKNWNWKKKVGFVLLGLAVLVIAIEVITGNALSNVFGKLFCGDRYMMIEGGKMGDGVCGFNADIQTILFSFLALLAGVVFMILGRKKRRKKS